MMKITCDLYADWIASIRQELTNAGFDHSALTEQDCAICWQSWNRRQVLTKVRAIKRADVFLCPHEHQSGLHALEAAVQAGNEIWPWQSKMIDRVSYEDGLLNDFGVLHFHLGATFESSGYVARTGPLLFAIVRDDAIYEIGVFNHGDWYELDILTTIDRNWPNLLDPVTIKGAIRTAHTPKNREEIKALRSANVCPIITLASGRIIFPIGGGNATDGTSNDAVHSADYWANFLRNADDTLIEQVRQLVRKGDLPSKDYIIRLQATGDEIAGMVEDKLKIILWRREPQMRRTP
jgi:hypothetical protein